MTTETAHGSLGLSTPWAREGLTHDAIEAIERLIPENRVVGVSVSADTRHWLLWLVRDGIVITSQLQVTRVLPHRQMYPLRAAVEFALRHWHVTELRCDVLVVGVR